MFVAINYISCQNDYRSRFEELFVSRAGAIDSMPGFQRMQVLRPKKDGQPYLVISEWENEDSFRGWMKSPAFAEGHRRGFADIEKAREEKRTPPMTSEFVTYEVLTR